MTSRRATLEKMTGAKRSQKNNKPKKAELRRKFCNNFLFLFFLIFCEKSHLGVDDGEELWLERGTADKEAVDVLLLGQLLAVGASDRPTVDDAGGLGHGSGDILNKPLPQGGVDLLSLLRGGGLAGANGPHRLVGNDNVGPVRHVLCRRKKTKRKNEVKMKKRKEKKYLPLMALS